MKRRYRQSVAAAAAVAALSGCVTIPDALVTDLESATEAVELVDVPFHPQITDQCGPAALASLLNASGIDVSAADLKPQIYIPGRAGSLQLEILAAARRHERIPYRIDPTTGAILDELAAGRPVLVLQNLGVRPAPVWHYAVVVGYLPHSRQFVLRSGEHRRHLLDAKAFIRTWLRADTWAIVTLEPGAMPANADPDRLLRAISALESTGHADAALTSYRSATARWPDNALAWIGLGNAAYAAGRLHASMTSYRKAADLEPDNLVAVNNLAQTYADLGCREEAAQILSAALSRIATDGALRSRLEQTYTEVHALPDDRACLLTP